MIKTNRRNVLKGIGATAVATTVPFTAFSDASPYIRIDSTSSDGRTQVQYFNRSTDRAVSKFEDYRNEGKNPRSMPLSRNQMMEVGGDTLLNILDKHPDNHVFSSNANNEGGGLSYLFVNREKENGVVGMDFRLDRMILTNKDFG